MNKYIFLFLSVLSFDAFAENAWYSGNVLRINTLGSDGSFQVVMDNEDIQTYCENNRINFRVTNMGSERTKAALSMALTAFASGKNWKVVIDLPTSEQVCEASSTASQGAGIE